MTVPLLIFMTVTAGVAASFQLLSESLFPHATRVRRRLAEEFRKGHDGGRRPVLFKGVDQLSVDPRTGGMSDLGMAELAPPPTRSDWGLRLRLQTMLEQANLDWSVSSLLSLAGGL